MIKHRGLWQYEKPPDKFHKFIQSLKTHTGDSPSIVDASVGRDESWAVRIRHTQSASWLGGKEKAKWYGCVDPEHESVLKDWFGQFSQPRLTLFFKGPGFCFVPAGGSYGSRGFENPEVKELIKKKQTDGHTVTLLSFGNLNKYYVQFSDGSSTYRVSEKAKASLNESSKGHGLVTAFAFNPLDDEGYWFRRADGETTFEALPPTLEKALDDMDESAEKVAISSEGGWCIIKKNKGWQYDGAPKPMTKFLKDLEKQWGSKPTIRDVTFGYDSSWAIQIEKKQ